MQAYEELKRLVDDVARDVEKAEAGNKAAGTRVRKQMQEIKKAAQAVRNSILESRSDKAAGGPPPVPPAAPTQTPPPTL